jgi:hypothetical protein
MAASSQAKTPRRVFDSNGLECGGRSIRQFGHLETERERERERERDSAYVCIYIYIFIVIFICIYLYT